MGGGWCEGKHQKQLLLNQEMELCNLVNNLFANPRDRLDFETMTGHSTGPGVGECNTNKFEATGQTGRNPPVICGTNTGYHSKFISRIVSILNTSYSSSVR